MKPQPTIDLMGNLHFNGYNYGQTITGEPNFKNLIKCKAPLGKVGDLLYVRETWKLKTGLQHDHHSWIHYKAGGKKLIHWQDGHRLGEKYGLLTETKWKPSIHMPKWASRIWLEITGVRVERVQDIKVHDCIREGVIHSVSSATGRLNLDRSHEQTKWDFETLWDSINKKRGYGWEVNPWVWVYEFKKVTN
jgi:hypothetical protein